MHGWVRGCLLLGAVGPYHRWFGCVKGERDVAGVSAWSLTRAGWFGTATQELCATAVGAGWIGFRSAQTAYVVVVAGVMTAATRPVRPAVIVDPRLGSSLSH